MITALGALGGAQNKAAGTPLTLSPSRAVPVGRVVVLFVSTDSVHNAGGPHGNMQQRWAVHDDAGNVWSTLGGATDGRSFFKIGASAHIFITQVRRALTTSSVITLTNQAEANVDARAMWAEEFDFHGSLWATSDQGPVAIRAQGVDPQAISISNLASQEYLLLHVLGVEGPNTDTYTWDADYTPITGTGTTGGVADTNIHVRGGYRIAELTADTVDVTANMCCRDANQVLVAVCAVPRYPFPNNPVLDDFNRADENPLTFAGAWISDRSTGPTSAGTPWLLQVSSNQARGAGGPSPAGGQFWGTTYEDCVEVYVDIPVQSAGDARGVQVVWHGTGAAEDGNASGHGAFWQLPDFGDTIHDNILFGNIGLTGGIGQERFRAWVDMNDGYKLGAARTDMISGGAQGVDRLFVDIGDGWEQIGASFRSGSGFFTSGLLGMAVYDGTARLDNFGGGEIPCFVGRPQIIRYR